MSVSSVVSAAVKVFDTVVGVLPASVAARLKAARKAVVTFAGAAVSVVAALGALPLSGTASTVVAAVGVVVTTLAAYATPNTAA